MGVWIETGSLILGSNEYPEFELGWIDFQSLWSSRQNELTYFGLFIVSTTTKVDGQHFISDWLMIGSPLYDNLYGPYTIW